MEEREGTNGPVAETLPVFDVETLRNRKIAELFEIARALGIPNYADMRKQDLIFRILEAQGQLLREQQARAAEEVGVSIVEGVLEIASDGGYGFLRSPESSYLPSPDDAYVSP